jgi:hypothetical protein
MRRTRIEIAKSDIIEEFDSTKRNIFKRTEIEKILASKREFWRLTQTTGITKFLDFMLEKTKLKKVKLEFPGRNEIRYTWGDYSIYGLVLTLKPNSFFSHYSAIFLHHLTEQIPKIIYLNHEQPQKPKSKTDLKQSQIDGNFKRPVRQSKYIAKFKDMKICILNGMNTGRLGVVEIEADRGEKIYATNLERTLIDIAVRPIYSGGIFEVLKAYRIAKEKDVSINKLAATLKKIGYMYPYHQVIGFYLDAAGVYDDSQIDLLHKIEMKYDFYLTHQMKETEYSPKWRLYYPKGFL